MAYKELIRHFSRVRAYMQHFYIYGFYTRDEFENGSARSYDDERRRVEGWLGSYMGYRQTPAGKSVFISFDSRSVRRNPLYRALKSKSFTDRDLTLHFLLLDALGGRKELTVPEMMHEISDVRLPQAEGEMFFDLSTLRGKANEYEELGLLTSRMVGNRKYFARAPEADVEGIAPLLAFFSETAPCGVIGSYLEDRVDTPCEAFRMKHHYIAQTLDSGLLCQLLDAIGLKRDVTIWHMGRDGGDANQQTLAPLYILSSVQDGRCYLVGWGRRSRTFHVCRLDRISRVKTGKPAGDFDELRAAYMDSRANRWGVSGSSEEPKHIEFTISCMPWESHVRRRLLRECRCGSVEEMEDGQLRFSAEVYDPMELLPWVRTFIGRITSFRCDDERVTGRFREDVRQMAELAAGEGAEG